MADIIDYASAGAGGRATGLPRVGGALGMAGAFIGTAIFVLGCFGISAAFSLSYIPLILGAVGLVLTLCGIFYPRVAAEDSHVVAALLVNVAVIAGALLEIMVLRGQPIFSSSGM